MVNKLRLKITFILTFMVAVGILIAAAVMYFAFSSSIKNSIYTYLGTFQLSTEGKVISYEADRDEPVAVVFIDLPTNSEVEIKTSDVEILEYTINSAYTVVDVKKAATKIYSEGKNKGFIDSFYYIMEAGNDGTLIVCEKNASIESTVSSLFSSIFAVAIVIILTFSYVAKVLAYYLVKPIAESFESQKQFLSDVSHELKTPVAAVQMNALALKEEIGDNKWLTSIHNVTVRMNSLITNLLTLSRMENANAKDDFQVFNLSDAVEEALLPLDAIAFEKGRMLEYDIQPEISINGSRDKMQQLAVILVDNAIKYSDENTTIYTKLVKKGKTIMFMVKDTGPEISKADQKKIFERFYRAEQSRNSVKNSYGLGLPIAKQITELHGGNIRVFCNKGVTTFQCVIHC